MTRHDDAWFERQLAHAQECLAVADKIHTPEELAAARAALAIAPGEPQHTLFNAPPSRESCPGDKPRPAAGGCAFLSGSLEHVMGEKFQVIPTIGALYVEVNEETVSLSQDDISGNGDNLGVDIPRVMLAHVLGYIMLELDIDEIKQIVDTAEGHARLKAKA